jgi:hypothetical protein
MSLEANKTIVRRMIEAYNKHNLDWFDDFIAPDYFDHSNQVGSEGVKQLFIILSKDSPIGMKLLTISLLKEIRYGLILLIQGHIQVIFLDYPIRAIR